MRDLLIAARFLCRHGFDEAASATDARELERLRALRERVREAWDASDDETAVALLNALRAECNVQPRLARGAGGAWAFRWDGPGVRCRCSFLNRSRHHSRRYCSDQCADRVNQASHRRRQRD